jgi:MFS family permease
MPMWPGLAVSMVALRLVDGVAAAMIWPSVFLWAAASAHDETERQKVMGWVNTCYLVGVALAFPLGGFANDLSRWTGAGIVASGVLFVVLAGLALVSGASDKSSAPAHAERVEGGASSAAWPYMVVGFLIFAAIGFPSFIAKLLPIQMFKISESAVGASVLPAALGLAVLAGPVSRLGARLGAYRAMMLGLALSLVGSIPLALATTVPSLQTLPVLIGCALPLGVGFLLAMPAWYARVAEIDPARKGQNLGAVMAAQGVGAVVAGPTGTWLFELAPFSPFIGTFALLLIGTAVASSASFRPQEPPAM